MTNFYRIGVAVLLSLCFDAAYAYGSSQSSGSCEKPVFSAFTPAPNKYLQSFREFSFQASANTSPVSINVNVSVGQNKYHFTHKELDITTLKNGHLEVKGKIDKPVSGGFARIDVNAHIKPGCEKTEGYLIRIY